MQVKKQKYSVYIDESGTLPDPKDKVVILAAIIPNEITTLDQINKELKKLARLKKQKGELKFYTAGEKTKKATLQTIKKYDIGIFILSVDKQGRKIPDTPQHFALLCWLLLKEIVTLYAISEVIFDRHFFRQADLEEFNQQLDKLLKINIIKKHVDSKIDKKVNIADMIAGATLAKESGKNETFYEIIKEKVTNYKNVDWVAIKRSFIKK